jgi:hypothetical protein
MVKGSKKQEISNLLNSMLTEEEVYSLIMMLVSGKASEGANAEEVAKLVAWARQVRLQGHMINLAIKGHLLIRPCKSGTGYDFISR